jgi:chaperonin GroEL (HSP60 family)
MHGQSDVPCLYDDMLLDCCFVVCNVDDTRDSNVGELKITESFKVKLHVLLSAHEACEMILRVDEIIRCAPRQRK